MPAKPISQREARAMRVELNQLHARDALRDRGWVADYPGGVNFASIDSSNNAAVDKINTARRLGHFVIAVDDGSRIVFFGLPVQRG